jgi:hypothetical protein
MPGGSEDSAIERDLRHIPWVQAIRAALYGSGLLKSVYDLELWRVFRRVPLSGRDGDRAG